MFEARGGGGSSSQRSDWQGGMRSCRVTFLRGGGGSNYNILTPGGMRSCRVTFLRGGGGSNYNILTPGGSTEAEPAVKPNRKIRRGREMAGLPQGGETPLGSSF